MRHQKRQSEDMNTVKKALSLSTTRKRVLRRDTTALAAVAVSLAAQPAFAYLDPSTGGMILSAILGLFATVGLALKTYWYKLKNIVTGRKPEASTEATEEQDSTDTPSAP